MWSVLLMIFKQEVWHVRIIYIYNIVLSHLRVLYIMSVKLNNILKCFVIGRDSLSNCVVQISISFFWIVIVDTPQNNLWNLKQFSDDISINTHTNYYFYLQTLAMFVSDELEWKYQPSSHSIWYWFSVRTITVPWELCIISALCMIRRCTIR